MRSELHSPLVKRKAKEKVKQSEKENEEVVTSNNTKSPRKQQRPIHNNKPNATSPVKTQKSRDFTVDIFTSKSSEAKEGEEEEKKHEEEVEEGTKKVGGSSVTAAEKVTIVICHCHCNRCLCGRVNPTNLIFGTKRFSLLSNIGCNIFVWKYWLQ